MSDKSSSSEFGVLSDEQIEAIAERAAERAMEKLTNHVYREVGRSVVQKAFWIVGVSVVGGYLWLKSNGYVK